MRRRSILFLLALAGGCQGAADLGGSLPAPETPAVVAGEEGGVTIASVTDGAVIVDAGVDDATPDAPVRPMPPSCVPGGPGRSDCGGFDGGDDCCATLLVAGGSFYRTYDNDGGPSNLADPATVSSFLLDKYPVTVGRFRQFVQAWDGGAGYMPPPGSGKHTHLNGGQGLVGIDGVEHETGWQSSYDSFVAPTDANLVCLGNYSTWRDLDPPNNESDPINCVNWYEAYAFCIWDGGFLPSEAEWAYAAAGGSEQRAYAWGSTPPDPYGDLASWWCYPGSVCHARWVGAAYKGVARWGQIDLVGNIIVFTADWNGTYTTPCTDCAMLTETNPPASYRSIRGAAYGSGPIYMNPAYRPWPQYPYFRDGAVGFRCARSP